MPEEFRTLPELLQRLISWCERTSETAGDADKQRFLREPVPQLALSKCIEMVGESAGEIQSRVPDFAKDNPQLSLAKAYGMRNRLAHIYENADLDIVWDTVVLFVPQMKLEAKRLLEGLSK